MVSKRENIGIWEGVDVKALMWDPYFGEQEYISMSWLSPQNGQKEETEGSWVTSSPQKKNGYEMEKKAFDFL